MSAAKHTPGPWWTTDHGVRDVGGYIAHTNSVQRYLGQEERYAFEVAQRDADKRLISAAPDLLEAVRISISNVRSLGPAGALAQVYAPYQEWLAKLEAAFAKATGSATC